MQVSVENVGKLERRLTVKFPADQYESRVRERIRELGRSVRLKGFRPGRIPPKVIEQRFGEQVRGEALSDLIRSTFRDAVEEQKLQPIADPNIDTDGKPQDGEIAYTATFEVMPELPDVDVAILRVDRPRSEVGEADVDAMIETLRVQRRVYEKVGRAATDGDLVIIDYAAGAAEAGFRHPAEGRERAATILGAEGALSAFDDALKGHAAGDELTFEVEFPATFPIPQLASRQAAVELGVSEVQEPKTPELDEVFIHNFGIADGTLETFRKEVRANLERELDNALRARLRNEVGRKLAATYADVDVPKVLETAEAESLVRATMPDLSGAQALPPATLDAARPVAHQRVIAGLLLRQLAQNNSLRVDHRRVTDRIAKIASTYEEPEQVVELYAGNPQMMENIRTAVLEDQVSEWVAEHADTTEVKLSFDEVMHPQNATA